MQSKLLLSSLGLLVLTSGALAVPASAQKAATKSPAKSVAVKASKTGKAAPTTLPSTPILYAAATGDAPVREKRVSLDFVAADINDVLKALALQADVNIVTAADVKGNITVSLARVTINEALDMVARLSGFQYAKVGPAYIVGSEKSVSDLAGTSAPPPAPAPEPVTEFIPYRFVRTADLGKAVSSRFPDLKMAAGDEKADEKASPALPRTITLTGAPERVAEARTFVKALDESVTFPQAGAATEVYAIKYASPTDLTAILSRLVPTVQVTLGPSQGFQSGSTGASASFSSTPAAGLTPAAPPGGVSGGAGTANPALAVATASAPTTLLLTGAPGDIARAREVLSQIDVRAPQMSFEARVMDMNNADFSKIGLSWDFTNGGNGIRIGEGDVTPGSAILGTGARRPGFGAIMRTPYSIGANLDLLATNNKARLLANPNLSALDGQPAVVFIGDQIKYVINREVTPTGTNIQTETATVGITLKVTGKASPDGTITLYVHPEVSVISGYLNLDGGIALPQIASRFVDTTIRVKDGETIAIGGLIRESDITNVRKVPFLGDLPFFGQLFRSTEKNKSRSEIVIFITSKILQS